MKRGKCKADLDSPMPVEAEPEDSGDNDCDREAMAQILSCSIQEAVEIENGTLETISELQAIDIDKVSLAHTVQSKIKQQLQMFLARNSLSRVPPEDILSLQQICEEHLQAARIVKIKLGDIPGEEQHVGERIQQVMVLDCGLLSGYICLLIRSGGCQAVPWYARDIVQIVSDALTTVLETCVMPVHIPANRLQTFAATEPFAALISTCVQILQLLATLASDIQFSETVLNTLEATIFRLLLADNGAEKIGLNDLRTAALDLLVQAFRHYPAQRQSIINEILLSRKKMPASQGPRDSRLVTGGSIQLFSVLIMRIVQAAADGTGDSQENERHTPLARGLVGATDGLRAPALRSNVTPRPSRKRAKKGQPMDVQVLSALASPLLEMATKTALQIISFVVDRALSDAKTSDESFRNFLYIFTKDLVRNLDCPEWPAAELLLRLLLFKMVRLLEADKTTTAVKLMAIDVLGLMAAAISGLNFKIRHLATSNQVHTKHTWYPRNMVADALQLQPRLNDLTAWKGPFHASVEFLRSRPSVHPYAGSAAGYLTAQWALKVCTTDNSVSTNSAQPKTIEQEGGRVAARLRRMMADQECWSMDPDFQCPTAPNARVAYHLTLLRSGFCESFERILHLLSVSVTSPQASIRCRSLKALLPVLEADPFIIDHTPLVKTLVSSRMKDISVAVRESSLRLISRCRELTPQLGVEVMPEIVRRVADDSITIRRRAMKILTEMYLHHPEGSTSSGIAEALLHRVADLDQTVRELACQSLAEIWISPYQPALTGKGACRTKLAVVKHLGLIARTVQRNRCLPAMLTTALQTILVTPSQGTAILHVYQLFVARMFEMIETPTRKGDGSMEPAATFQVLLIFAKINAAHIFTTQQIQLLQPYVGPIGSADDMSTYRSVVSILSHVLPRVSNVDSMLLRSISTDLIRQVSRFNRPILHEVIRCLQTLSEITQDKQPLTRLTLSCLDNIRKMVGVRIHDPADQHTVRKIKKLLLIAGMCGRHCNFEAQLDVFQTRFGDWRGQSVSELMIATFSRFSSPGPPTDLRMAALDAICMVCQLWPKHFASAMVSAQFEKAFEEKDASLETIILTSFKELLLAKEQHSEANDGVAVKLDHIGGSQLDRVAAFITQTFMSHRKDLTRIALATQDEQALLAVEVLASMHRQGLLHPKEYAPICIALETSHNRRIADLSYRMHQILHAKYETIIAKEYMRAVDVAYEYQRDVVGNVRGATCDPYLSILNPMVEVIKAGRSNGRTKFHESLCTRIDLDLSHTSRLDLPRYLQRSQFILENIAFFEYASVKDLTAALIAMEKVFTRSGVVVVDAIATEILGGMSSGEKSGRNDPNRLQVLAAFSTVLASLWHTKAYLTQQYGLSGTRGSTPYETSKDSGKAPSKVDNINGRALWERNCLMMASLDSEQTMLAQCCAFVKLFQEDIGSNVVARPGGILPSTPRGEGEDNLRRKGRKRKALEAGSGGEKRKLQGKR